MPKMSKMPFTQGSPYSDAVISLPSESDKNLTLKSLTDTFAAGGNISASLGNTSGTWWVSQNPGFQIRMLKTGFLNRIIPIPPSSKSSSEAEISSTESWPLILGSGG
jgi:hypothetical protein